MIKFVKAELRRIVYHKSNLIFVAVAIIFCLATLSVGVISIFTENSESGVNTYKNVFSFPNSIFNSISLSFIYFLVLTPIISAMVVGSDYNLDTWKMILPRTPQKSLLLLGKIISVWIYLFLLLLIAFFLISLFGLLGMFWLNTSIFDATLSVPFDKQSRALDAIVFVVWYASISILITVLSRSVFIGASITFAVLVFFNIAKNYFPEYISMWLVVSHLGNFLSNNSDTSIIHDETMPIFSVSFSWLVVVLNLCFNLGISFFVINKQEFGGE